LQSVAVKFKAKMCKALILYCSNFQGFFFYLNLPELF
jgi:hypothetical protein